ncbi:hypothetical protein BJX99DRAFT_227439 [Aspergillus californicus]
METNLYSSLDWALATDPGEPPFPWEAPAQREGAYTDPQLEQLLSASSYPIPEAAQFQGRHESGRTTPVPLWGGLIVSHDDTGSDNTGSQQDDTVSSLVHANSSRLRPKVTDDSVRKRGRPRKLHDDDGVKPEERRRMQVRMAQRAYRSRKDANVSSLKDRINQLESTVKQMSSAVINFGDELIRSGALESHPDLLKPLGNTVQACLAIPALPPGDPDYQLEIPDSTSGGRKKQMLSIYPSPSRSSEPADTMELLEFTDRLHVACAYQGYLVCANTQIPLRRIERSFRMLLSLMPRAFVAEYFKDWLLARAGHETMDHWDHIPFYRVGGAGTHYPEFSYIHQPFSSNPSASTVENDLSQFSPEIQREFDDDYFDLGDVAGYLHEKQIVLPAVKPTVTIGAGFLKQPPDANSVSRFIQSLVRVANCLGRSPGFKRRDVERLVEEYRVYSTAST